MRETSYSLNDFFLYFYKYIFEKISTTVQDFKNNLTLSVIVYSGQSAGRTLHGVMESRILSEQVGFPVCL